MSLEVIVRNRQRRQKIDTSTFREIILNVLREEFKISAGAVGVAIVGAEAMAKLNEQFLGHAGSTDVITFDYQEDKPQRGEIHGELFLCLDEAAIQARHYKTSWQAELIRYAVHGILHLRGYDDKHAKRRAVMKKAEDRLVDALQKRWSFKNL